MNQRLDADPYLRAVAQLGGVLLSSLAAAEHTRRHLHPPRMDALRPPLARLRRDLDEQRAVFDAVAPPSHLAALGRDLAHSAACASSALDCLAASGADGIARVLEGMRQHHRAEEALYPLRRALPPVSRFFAEPFRHTHIEALEARPDAPADPGSAALQVGLQRAQNAPDERGGFSLYVPEAYDGTRDLPLVVALHGGSGHGADFLWTWLREARSRHFIVLAPTSRGSTWSLSGPDVDAAPLLSMLEYVRAHWRVDTKKILLTGLSDGATYSLLLGLQPGMPFTALAPVSGVLHPANFANGNLERARGTRVYLVHGALDWMFPISLAQAAAAELERVGAELCFREIADLSHTYPREENAAILEWLDPRLAPDAVIAAESSPPSHLPVEPLG